MKAKVNYLRLLLQLLCDEFGEPMTMSGLKIVSYDLGFSSNYCYKNIYSEISKLRDEDELGVRETSISILCQRLGFKSYPDFVKSFERGTDSSLENLVGSYYSYVRMNAKSTAILRSPVRIWQSDKRFYWELQGPSFTYKGQIERHHGCMFILMKSKEGKVFHHVYKIGQGKNPTVLQGVFSAVSSSFDPIGGRAVLIRSDKNYKELTNERMTLPEIRKSHDYAAKELSIFFKTYHENNLAIKKSTTFDKSDLV